MSLKFAIAQLPTVPRPCFQKWRLKTTGQVRAAQFSCRKKLFEKLAVNQCYHAFQEDFRSLISKSISCMIDLKIKQIRNSPFIMRDMG